MIDIVNQKENEINEAEKQHQEISMFNDKYNPVFIENLDSNEKYELKSQINMKIRNINLAISKSEMLKKESEIIQNFLNKSKFNKSIQKEENNKNKILKHIKKIKNKNKSNNLKEFKKIMLDLNLQKKLNKNENFSVDKIHMRDELIKEIEEIKNEVKNKQKIIQKIRNDEEKIKNYDKVFDSNQRLYYTWYKNKKENDISNFSKKSKLTELYFYNKTKEEIKQNNMEQKYLEGK